MANEALKRKVHELFDNYNNVNNVTADEFVDFVFDSLVPVDIDIDGFIGFIAQASAPSAPAATGFRFFADVNGNPAFIKKNGSDVYVRTFASTNTANRTYTFPDATGTIALAEIVKNTQTASYTLALTDANKLVQMNVAASNGLTVPTNAAVAFPIGTKILVEQIGAGQTTIISSGGTVTLNSKGGSLVISARYGQVVLIKTAADVWEIAGDLQDLLQINDQVDSYTLVASDIDKMVRITKATVTDLTVPPNAGVAFAIGTQIIIAQGGAGAVTIVAGAGVTINSLAGALEIAGQYGEVTLQKVAINTWLAAGALV